MVLLVAIVSSWSLLSSHVLFGNDALFHLARIEGIREGLAGGQFPVRLYGYFFGGYGYPAGLLYPDLFLYIPALLRLLGCSVHVACHVFYLLINLATAFIAWWSFARLAGWMSAASPPSRVADTGSPCSGAAIRMGAAGAMIYTGFLYRLADLYSRGALGEVLAMTFMPLALVSFWLVLHRSSGCWPGVVAGCTGVLQSHILSSLMMVAAMVLMLAVSVPSLLRDPLHRREAVSALARAACFILVLNLWFYGPFLDVYRSYDFQMKSAIASAGQLAANAYDWDAIAKMRGFCGAPLLLLALGMIRAVWRRVCGREIEDLGRGFWVLLVLGFSSIFAISTSFPWDALESVPALGRCIGVLQFPFRLMLLGSIALSFCAGIALVRLVSACRRSCIAVLFCCVLSAVGSLFLLSRDGLVLPYSHTLPDPVAWSIHYEDSRLYDVFPLLTREPAYSDVRASDLRLIENGTLGWLYPDYLPAGIPFGDIMSEVPVDVPGVLSLAAGELYRLSPDDPRLQASIETFSGRRHLWDVMGIVSLAGWVVFVFCTVREAMRRSIIPE